MSKSHFIVAEAGINHNGNIDIAIEMIKVAKNSGADAIKFQTFKATEFCGDINQEFEYFSQGNKISEKMIEMFSKYEFSPQDWATIKNECDENEIEFFSTPQNYSDLQMLLKIGINRIKIGSDDLININLLEKFSSTGLPIILSSGMSSIAEIHEALVATNWYNGADVSVLICTSLYPTSPENASVSRVKTLQKAFPDLNVGFSDHTTSNSAAIVAAALGATIFEKHFTLDKNLPGPDHWFSQSPEELKMWVNCIKEAKVLLGNPHILPQVGEFANKKEFQRVLVANNDILEGEKFTSENLTAMRMAGGFGIPASEFKLFVNKTAKKRYRKGDAIEL